MLQVFDPFDHGDNCVLDDILGFFVAQSRFSAELEISFQEVSKKSFQLR
jgi:hypothetical protein